MVCPLLTRRSELQSRRKLQGQMYDGGKPEECRAESTWWAQRRKGSTVSESWGSWLPRRFTRFSSSWARLEETMSGKMQS